MDDTKLQFYALYLTRFAGGFGFITLVTLLPKFIDYLEPSAVTLLGFSLSAGFVIGMYKTGFTLAQTLAVVPLAWGGDRFDKRLVLVGSMALGVVAYALFPLADTSLSFILARGLQGVAVTGAGLMSLALVGEIADEGTRANHIGKANASRFASSIIGAATAGGLYDYFGSDGDAFTPIFALITVILAVATVLTWLSLNPDRTRIHGFPFSDLALNRRIISLTSFRAQYAVAVTLVRTWVPIYAGVTAASGGLAYGALAVSLTVIAEKFCNMLLQPYTGRVSDRSGRALFIFFGGGLYGLVALAVPFSPAIGAALGLPSTLPVLGPLSSAFIPLVTLSGLLGVADSFREPASMALFADEGTDDGGVASSFGIRELVWRPGSVVAPLLGGYLMAEVGMEWVFYVGGVSAITGVLTFLGVLSYFHGPSALTEW
ncbi:Predicted arabinose efflux permease, MFS family [Halogranum rubrum]|uniref:Predicted arabinose efflux permease, MFS family n=1 Tax=Halogranum rubrum TaxID=553466 RepID=A0A1I4I9V4_9EURY|nr:MFS transporter [Halogranum rubrum]SFL50877.1 Predicted arabinose efflux permease, MFS family [Halogranum rubrum]